MPKNSKAAPTSALEKGFFTEPSYVSLGDPYGQKEKLPANSKGSQMMVTRINKPFDPNPPRIFEGEAYFDPIKRRRAEERKSKTKNLTYKFTPTGAGTETFSGTIPYFSPQTRPQPKKPKEPANFMTNPGKKGTGYGYASVTFSGPLPYIASEYDRAEQLRRKDEKVAKNKMVGKPFKSVAGPGTLFFDDNPFKPSGKEKARRASDPGAAKQKGKKVDIPFRPTATISRSAEPGRSSHLNTFTKFEYKSEPYGLKPPKSKSKPIGPPFRPSAPSKSTFTQSISAMHAVRTAKR
eukprot:m.96670 g.96670  ORF g.96670 m.96670 type:complete len:293 (-) comp14803_c1_seq2:120-998(-)